MMNYRADLHCHTTASDGTLTPTEVLHLAKEVGLSGLCITDHDSLMAYTPELFEEASKLGIKLFTGVEFSARYHSVTVHILGYGVKKTQKILAFCERHRKRREERNLAILEKLNAKGLSVTEEELKEVSTGEIVGRPHIALVLLNKGYVKSIQNAFDRYIGDKKSCYVEGESFPVQETLDVIHEAGGKAFIAHPQLVQRSGIIKILLGMDFDGIECYYSLLHPEKEQKWCDMAKKKNMLISGGSDFHGAIKPHIKLGCSWVDQETAEKIFGES